MSILETERLALREFTSQDAAFILALVNDPEWIANIGERHLHTEAEAATWIAEKIVTSYRDKGHGLWAVERRSDGMLVGMCGLLARDTLPEIDVGYALAAPFRGHGYAREATAACLRYARDVLGKARVLAIVNPRNAASIHLLLSVGMVADGVRALPGETHETAFFTWNGATP